MSTLKELLDLIDEYEINAVFEAIDNLGIKTPEYSRMKKEFAAGKTDVDFTDRLKVLVRSLKIPASGAGKSAAGSAAPAGNIQSQVKLLLAKGEPGTALEVMLNHAEKQGNVSLERDCIHQLGRYNSAKKQKDIGVLSQKDWDLTEARILEAVRNLLTEI